MVGADPKASPEGQQPEMKQQAASRGRGRTSARWWELITFGWCQDMITLANERPLQEEDAAYLMPDDEKAHKLAGDFDAKFQIVKAAQKPSAGTGPGIMNSTFKTLLLLHWPEMLRCCLWAAMEIAVRLLGPVILRQFLRWLQAQGTDHSPPEWHGWLLAVALGAGGFAMAVLHHQLFWAGMHMGFLMRQQTIAAIHSKVLRLNSSAISQVSSGHVVNLVSNDVRRFDDAGPFWVFLWAGPLELSMVFLMVALELGVLPALAGIAATLLLIPIQAALVRPVGTIRQNTAAKTDERVRLAGEAIQGSLAMKMLSWELPISQALCSIRGQEAAHIKRMADIRAINNALYFAITPVVAFSTFAVYRACSGTLNIPSVFYALSLLSLPKLYMVLFFITAMQSFTELGVSMRRVDTFLSMEEPAAPAAGAGPGASGGPGGPCVALRGADYDWARPMGHAPSPDSAGHTHAGALSGGPPALPPGALGAAGRSCSLELGPTLQGLRLELSPGELLGVCGEVGSGKSSMLAALLGELLPVAEAPGGAAEAGPLLRGSVAYCSQIPWIVSGTIRDNIVFNHAFDDAWYSRVLEACALDQDLRDLPAGDMTELGERGINLSGGQKARVALARCCYSRADIQLLDDPLAAVDPRVGRILFEEAVSGLMKGSMRVLVTHQRQFLPRCDRVLVLRAGRVQALGTWAELEGMGLTELMGGSTAVDATGKAIGDSSVDDLSPEPQRQEPEEAGLAAVAEDAPGPGVEEQEGQKMGSGEEEQQVDIDTAQLQQQQKAHVTIVASPAPAMRSGSSRRQKSASASASRFALPSSRTFALFRSGGQRPAGEPPGSSDEEEEEEAVQERGGATQGGFLTRGRSFGTGLMRLVSMKDTMASRRRMKKMKEAEEAEEAEDAEGAPGQLVRAEGRETGTIKLQVYLNYAKAVGPLVTLTIAFLLFAGQAVYLASDWWLALWSRSSSDDQMEDKWLWVYGLLTGIVVVVSFVRAFVFFDFSVKAATMIHNRLVQRVLKAPLSFFHMNPTGRILNRFSKDLAQVDDLLPVTLYDALQTGFGVLSTFVLVSIAVPVVLPVFIPLAISFHWLRLRYVQTSREVKRWEAVTRSPVFASFSASLKGLPTIRAFSSQARFHTSFLNLLQSNAEWFYAFISTARWIGFRLDVISAVTLLATALLAMAIRSWVSPYILGLALTYILQLTGYLQWFVRQTAEVENHMTALERLLEYTRLEQEPPDVAQGGGAPPEGWPTSGALRFDNVSAVYRPGLPPVLQNISFELPAGSSCGLVGRTGSGKSSLMLTLFRLIDVTSGTMYLDGVDAASIGLDALRAQLAIIPQDPVLFSGTIRSNLDPWNKHQDAALWEVLSAVKLNKVIASSGGLHVRMQEAGDNLSVGQRQLFCLARALLQDARVLALDEATANVDRTTDALIQEALRDFAHSDARRGRVLLVIAHRIDTIMDMDKLLVLASGELLEQGSPAELCDKPGGMFARMVASARVAASGAAKQR